MTSGAEVERKHNNSIISGNQNGFKISRPILRQNLIS